MTVIQKSVRVQKTLLLAMIVFLVLFNGFFCFVEYRNFARWQNMVENWTECPAVLVKHERYSSEAGKNRKTVSRIEYRYEYNGRACKGTKIGIGLSSLPQTYKAGMKVSCLVNPENGDSVLKYRNSMLGIFAVLAVMLISVAAVIWQFVRISKADVDSVPEEFTEYCRSQRNVEPAELKRNRKFFAIQPRKILDRENPRFLIYHVSHAMWAKVLAVALLVVFSMGPLLFQEYSTVPGVLFAVLLLYFVCRKKSVVFDLGNRCIRFEFERHLKELDLRPAKPERVIPFEDVTQLVFSGLNQGFCHLEIVNGRKNVVIRKRDMQQLMREAVILAGAMSGVPIIDTAHSEYMPRSKRLC